MHKIKRVLKYILAVFFALAGLNHFRVPYFYVSIMPPYLPFPSFLVYVSGICEIALGVLLLVPWLTRLAAWGLIALLIAVFPANLHMAVNAEHYPEFSVIMLWARLPLQVVLIAWVYWYTLRDTLPRT